MDARGGDAVTWIAVLVGGAVGSAARHGVNAIAPRLFGSANPYATAVANLVGAFIIGVLAGAISGQRLALSPAERAFYLTGILGGFTTFSSFMFDSLVLWQAGATTRTIANLVAQVLLGVVLVFAGYRLGFGAAD